MKVAVITRHGVSNYGSLLQAMATQEIINSLGHECTVIDYIREDEHYSRYEQTMLKRKPEWYNNPVKRLAYLALRQPESFISGKRFEKERKKFLNLTKLFATYEELERENLEADVFLTGSDQVWGPVANGAHDPAYCLAFTKNKQKRVAYAASFGRSSLDSTLEDYYQHWLSRYMYLSVREKSAKDLLEGMGLSAEQVLDPTLLMKAEEWDRYISSSPKGKFVLVYQIHNDKKLNDYAEKVAREKRLPLIRISTSLRQIVRGGVLAFNPAIGQFLAYIKNAEILITDSFHGTAFAINFNTQFIEVLPNNNTGTRNVSLLELTGLTSRVLKDVNNVSLADETIDFSFANQVLAKQREFSINVLRAMIETAQE